MSNEIQISYEDGKNIYVLIRRASDGYIWNPGTSAFEAVGTWNDARVGECDIPITAHNGELYMVDFPAAGADRYIVNIYVRPGANPAVSDELIGSGEIVWRETGELTADKVLANKAVQNKTTGKIDYYDDDGLTIILTHTPTDAESTITRTPS